jgi:lipoate-protein ligase A
MAWRFLDFQQRSIFENMAIDEAVFRETIKNKQQPTIRFYSSYPSAVSIGYFQDATKELNIGKCRVDGIDIVRRITGGKAVFHFNEITYCVSASRTENLFAADIQGTYEVISRCIARGLRDLGIAADLAEEGRVPAEEELKSCCFSVPSRNELLVGGRKICGSAQVRRREGFLQHGLLLMDFNPESFARYLFPARSSGQNANLKKSITAVNLELASPAEIRHVCSCLKKGFIEELGVKLEEGNLTPAEEKLKDALIKKYTDEDWNIEREKYFKQVEH